MSAWKSEQHKAEPYPLKFETVLRETIWGGHRLEAMLGKGSTTDRQIGEAWIVWSGLHVANGYWQGQSLAGVVENQPEMILGEELAKQNGGVFPLLVKLIDARDNLSVQVHPGDPYAQEREAQSFGKSEMWYVLDVQPEASIIHGVKRSVAPSEVAAAVETTALGDLLESVPVQAGDVVYNPAGTVHALGKGIFIYELQQSSDITYRLYDWGRKQSDGSSRELHIDKSIDVLIPEPFSTHKIQPVDLPSTDFDRRLLCACRYFVDEWMRIRSTIGQSTGGRRFDILTMLQGGLQVSPKGKPSEGVGLSAGESLLIPAALGDYELRPTEENAVLIKAYVPDLLRDVVIPLRELGIADAEILQLGGDRAGNDLVGLM